MASADGLIIAHHLASLHVATRFDTLRPEDRPKEQSKNKLRGKADPEQLTQGQRSPIAIAQGEAIVHREAIDSPWHAKKRTNKQQNSPNPIFRVRSALSAIAPLNGVKNGLTVGTRSNIVPIAVGDVDLP